MDIIAQLAAKAKSALTAAARELGGLVYNLEEIAASLLQDPMIADLFAALSLCDPYFTLYGPVSAALLLRALVYKCGHDCREDYAHAIFYGLCGTVL